MRSYVPLQAQGLEHIYTDSVLTDYNILAGSGGALDDNLAFRCALRHYVRGNWARSSVELQSYHASV